MTRTTEAELQELDNGDRVLLLGATATTTLTVADEDCPALAGMPGWGYGDTNHDHVGPGTPSTASAPGTRERC